MSLPDRAGADQPWDMPGPPLLQPPVHLAVLGWAPDAYWVATASRAPVSEEGIAPVRVRQPAAPLYDGDWPIGRAFAGTCFYQLAFYVAPRRPRSPVPGQRLVYARVWRPGASWYGVIEDQAGARPEQAIRGPELTLRQPGQGKLLQLLRELRHEPRGAPHLEDRPEFGPTVDRMHELREQGSSFAEIAKTLGEAVWTERRVREWYDRATGLGQFA